MKSHLKNSIVDIFNNYGELIFHKLNSKCNDGFFNEKVARYLQEDAYSCEMSMITNDVKSIVSDRAVCELLVLTIATSLYDVDAIKSAVKEIYVNDLYGCYNTFGNPKNKESIVCKLKRFVYKFKNDSRGLDEKILIKNCEGCYERLQSAIEQAYAEESYSQVIEDNDKFDAKEVIKETTEKLNFLVAEKVAKIGLKKPLDNVHSNGIFKSHFLLTSFTIPVHFINADELTKSIHSYLDVLLINIIIRASRVNSFNIVNGYANEKEMIDFLSCIDEGKMILGSNPLSYLQDYTKYGLVRSILSRNHNYVSGREGYIASIDFNKVNLEINNAQVEINHLTDEKIMQQIITENDKFYVNVINYINIQFSKEDAEDYFRKEKRKVCIYCDVMIKYHDDKIGDCIILQEE